MIDWTRMVETLIAAGAGAAAVVFIDWIVKYYLYRKKNFRESVSIQLALHQILSVSLQMRKFYDNRKDYFIKFYTQEEFNNSEQVWIGFRHIDFPPFMNTFDIIGLDWDLTQFLSGKENKTRKLLKYLIPIKLGYQSLMSITKQRNELVWFAQQKIELARANNQGNFEYANDNLKKVIGVPVDERLRGMTDKYVETIDSMIIDSHNAFNALAGYIKENFCHSMPLTLEIPADLKNLLKEIEDAENKKSQK